ncbi:ATP-binding cassette domain-containing protein [Actinomadura kijaniata]|uniref:ATP-binding cassette domain-containing protein n=1 Tax=Actinomadura kijaniata TaxID=46161 RepID=UPI000835B386|nr:ABC transporter ATP-binding protein [Actinomadura kijaniata]
MSLLTVEGLTVEFGGARAVRGVSFGVGKGECLAIVGESGSGKSVTARSLVGLSGGRVAADRLEFGGEDLRGLPERAWRRIRGRRIGFVLQDALQALDPLRTVGREVAEPLVVHRTVPRRRIPDRVRRLLEDAGVPDPERRAGQYPHQLSGGLRQRALIASALAAEPELIVADEPTTALDVGTAAQVLDLLAGLRDRGTGVILISHDLSVVARLADRIAVMKDGLLVEQGPAGQVLTAPRAPYTRMLLDAVPSGYAEPVEVGEPVLEARSVSKRYDGRTVVDGVSFELRAGESLGLVGGSGSGKTTLARIALGLVEPDAGTVLLDGEPWSGLPERRRRPRRARIQPVPQDPYGAFDPRYTVGRLLDEASRLSGETATAEDLLRQVGLTGELLDRRPRDLSGGQRQRVAIARALALRPAVLVCDEPTSALDVSVQAGILALLDRLQRERGLALLFISHDLAVVRKVTQRVVELADGRVVASGPTRDWRGDRETIPEPHRI